MFVQFETVAMANHFDMPRGEADDIISEEKTAPTREFSCLSGGSQEKWEMAVGVATKGGLYKRALTVQLLCHRSLRPFRENFKFSLFYQEHGRTQRVYQLDTTNAPLGDEGDHEWPHQHIGRDRICFKQEYPDNFSKSIAYFCRTTNITFEERIPSPFEFQLRGQ